MKCKNSNNFFSSNDCKSSMNYRVEVLKRSAAIAEKRRMRRDFTLIELLIVISIIAILASLLLPALNSAKKRTRMISCANKLKQIGIGCFMYTNDFSEYMPKCSMDVYDPPTVNAGVHNNNQRWWVLLTRFGYLGGAKSNFQYYQCLRPSPDGQRDILQCPSVPVVTNNDVTTYEMNGWQFGGANLHRWVKIGEINENRF